MKRLTLALICFFMVIFISCGKDNPETKEEIKQPEENPQSELYTLQPGVGNKYINSKTTANDLVSLFGKENVKKQTEQTEYSEETFYFTEVFPNSKDSIRVYFNNKNYKGVSRIELGNKNSKWILNGTYGIKVGTTLEELEKLYGGVFDLQHLMWDGNDSWAFEFDETKNKEINEKNFENIGLNIFIEPTNWPSNQEEKRFDEIFNGEKFKSNEKLAKEFGFEVSQIHINIK